MLLGYRVKRRRKKRKKRRRSVIQTRPSQQFDPLPSLPHSSHPHFLITISQNIPTPTPNKRQKKYPHFESHFVYFKAIRFEEMYAEEVTHFLFISRSTTVRTRCVLRPPAPDTVTHKARMCGLPPHQRKGTNWCLVLPCLVLPCLALLCLALPCLILAT